MFNQGFRAVMEKEANSKLPEFYWRCMSSTKVVLADFKTDGCQISTFQPVQEQQMLKTLEARAQWSQLTFFC